MNAKTIIRPVVKNWLMSPLGTPNPLPHFRAQQPIQHKPTPPDCGLNVDESARRFAWGADSILPYRVQDQYGRAQTPHECVVIEVGNGRLQLIVAPQFGGRVLGLRDILHERELLFDNDVFQPANLGSLNAWFSGGIEWNGLIPGHSPFSCSPVFCGIVKTSRGDVLRLYEFDRIVEASWQIDLFLPADDDRLFVHGRLVNGDDYDKQAYWWTNIAVRQTKGMRIVGPAEYVIEHVLPGNQLERFSWPHTGQFDGSYPDRWHDATSVFFRAPQAQRRTICALGTDGTGLGHVATNNMTGRKFFYFGTGSGGGQWMDFLSTPGQGNYVEIQSGITPTQNQRFALPANGEVHWTEGMAYISADPAQIHSADYATAVASAAACIESRFPEVELAAVDAFLREVSHQPIDERISFGSPWGIRHEQLTGRPLAEGLDFSVPSVTSKPNAWDDLLQKGTFSAEDLSYVPEDVVVSPRWCNRIVQSAAQYGETWLHALILGISALDSGLNEESREHILRSLLLKPTWLAYRQYALVVTDPLERENAYRNAWAMADAPPALALEIVRQMLGAGRIDAAKTFISQLPDQVRAFERITLADAEIAAHERDWARLSELLQRPFATIREGETLLDTLWHALQRGLCEARLGNAFTEQAWAAWQTQFPLPKNLDFRMQGAGRCPPTQNNQESIAHGQR